MRATMLMLMLVVVGGGSATLAANAKVDGAFMMALLDSSVSADTTLAGLGPLGPDDCAAIREYLGSPIAPYRSLAAALLGRLRDSVSVGQLATMLAEDESQKAKEAASEALVMLGSVSMPPLIALLEGSSPDRDMGLARKTCVGIGADALPPLILASVGSGTRVALDSAIAEFDGGLVQTACQAILRGKEYTNSLSPDEQWRIATRWVGLCAHGEGSVRSDCLAKVADDDTLPADARERARQEFFLLQRTIVRAKPEGEAPAAKIPGGPRRSPRHWMKSERPERTRCTGSG